MPNSAHFSTVGFIGSQIENPSHDMTVTVYFVWGRSCLTALRTAHWPAPGALAAAESRFRASMSATPMNEDTTEMPPRVQKEPNLLHTGFQCECRLPFLPSSAIEAAVAAPVANRTMITWDNDNRRRILERKEKMCCCRSTPI